MVSNILRKIQKLAAVGTLSLCAVGSASAGLFCNMELCQEQRAYYSPACEQGWGYHPTCWRKFPPVEPCSGWGDYCPSCQTDGGIQPAGGAPMQFQAAPPLLQGAPVVVQPPATTYGAPIQQPQTFTAPSYGAPMQGTPMHSQPMQPMQSFDEPMQMTPNGGADNGNSMPPLPDSAYMPQQPSRYMQASQSNWTQQPYGGMRPATVRPQGLPPANSTQGMPIRGISFSRVRPTTTSSAAAPKRTLLQRMLPGGK